jgi:hypothetical protein
MTQSVRIIVVGVPEAALDISSNKRVKGRPPLYESGTRRDPWPRNYQPIPDAETRRHLDEARKEIVRCRPAIARELKAAQCELARDRPAIERFLYGGSGPI